MFTWIAVSLNWPLVRRRGRVEGCRSLLPTAPYPTIPATSSLHVLGGAPVESRIRVFMLPLVFHSLGRVDVKSVKVL